MLTSCHVASAGARGHVVVPGRKLDGVSRSEVHVKLEQEHTGTIYKMCGLYINHQDLLCPKNVLTLMQAVQN